MHDVAVGHAISLSLEAHLTRVTGTALAAERHIVIVGDGLGADEAALEIRMYDGGGLRRLGPARDRPRCRLLRAGGEIGDQIEEPIAGADQAGEAGLRETDCGEIVAALV